MKINAASRLHQERMQALCDLIDEPSWMALASTVLETNKVTAGQQVVALDLWKKVQDLGMTKQLLEFVANFKALVSKISAEVGIEIAEVVEAFKTRPMFGFLKAIRFSLTTLLKPLKAFAQLYKAGILKVFAEIHKTKAFQKLHDGALSVDQFLDQYPLLRKLAGPAIAGLMIWMFLSGNFTGEPSMDMDLTGMIKAALYGHWSAADLFTSPQGLAAIALLLTGLTLPWPTPLWLDEAVPLNLLVALCYTAFKHAPKGKAALTKIKQHMKFGRI